MKGIRLSNKEVMERMTDNTRMKYAAIFASYAKVFESYGDNAKYIPKQVLYQRVADIFFMSPITVSKVIRWMIANPPTELEQSEAFKKINDGYNLKKDTSGK